MPHIHTAHGWHDQTVSAYIIYYQRDQHGELADPRLLLHMHKKLRILMQPGGHVELHENQWQAITHELLEETGYDMDQLTLLQPVTRISRLSHPRVLLHPHPLFTNTHDATTPEMNRVLHRHTDTTYLFTTTEMPRHALSEGESQDVRWLSLQDILDAPPETISSLVKDCAPAAFQIVMNDEWWGCSPLDFKTSL